jgi:hypothetical protein
VDVKHARIKLLPIAPYSSLAPRLVAAKNAKTKSPFKPHVVVLLSPNAQPRQSMMNSNLADLPLVDHNSIMETLGVVVLEAMVDI